MEKKTRVYMHNITRHITVTYRYLSSTVSRIEAKTYNVDPNKQI